MSCKKTERQLNEIEKQYINKMRNLKERYKKETTEVLKLKNSANEVKNVRESISSRIDKTEDRISELEDRNFDITESEEKKK